MLKSPLVRFLLADDPGAGKTIMAGLLLKELRFRGLADRILVVVPPLVARQWQEEYVTEHFNKAMQKEKRNVGFAMTILQRRLTSSLAAISASLTRRHLRLRGLLDQVRALAATKARGALSPGEEEATLEDLLAGAAVDDLDDLAESARWDVEDSLVERLTNAESIDELEAEVLALERLMRQARAALGGGSEAKLIQLTDAILRDAGLAARGEKLLIFTEAQDTLSFLVSQLRGQGFKVAVHRWLALDRAATPAAGAVSR